MVKRYKLISTQTNQDVGGTKLVYKVTRAEQSLLKSLKNKSEEVVFLKPTKEIWGNKNKKAPLPWLMGNINYTSFKDVYMFFRYKEIKQHDQLFSHISKQEKEFIIEDSTTVVKKISLKEQCLLGVLVSVDNIINLIKR